MTEGTTFLSARWEYFDKRFSEIDILIELAKQKRKNEDVYKTLCNAAQVLLAAHYEGSIKDFAYDFISDVNKYDSYKNLPEPIKRTFCDNFYINLESNKKLDNCKKKLLNFFEFYDLKVTVSPFLYNHELREDNNKNVSPRVLNKYSKNFGVNDIFLMLHHSRLDDVFENSVSTIDNLRKELRTQLINGVREYPYTVDASPFNFNTVDLELNERTLWQEFIDSVIESRNNIAHGELPIGNSDIDEIKRSRIKIELLLYAYAIIICNKITPFSQRKESVRDSAPNLGLLFNNI